MQSTRRATDSAVRTFKTYLREKLSNEDFEEMTPSELDFTLSKFYAEARTVNYTRNLICGLSDMALIVI
jgi:hypothetical protein